MADTKQSDEQKLCFVTVGATADFSALLEAVCDETFLQSLRSHGYTELRVQHGQGGQQIFSKLVSQHQLPSGLALIHGIVVKGFDFRASLQEDMRTAKGGINEYGEGVIISHAGTGSILEAFRVNAPLILVPNTMLLDNHQQELAEELSRQKYAVLALPNSLSEALAQIEKDRKTRVSYLAVNHRPNRRTFVDILDEEMGFLD